MIAKMFFSKATKAVPAHTRRVPKTDLANTGDAVPFFDESRVPVETIMVMSTEMQQLKPEQFPHAQLAFEGEVSLPLYTRMTDEDQTRVIRTIREILGA